MTAARIVFGAAALVAVLGGPLARPAAADTTPTMRDAVAHLDRALERLAANDLPAAAAAVKAFQHDWVDVEGLVKTRSPQAYVDVENDMALATALLTGAPPDPAKARGVIERMKAELAPFLDATSYGVFDAAVILLREGLEALLVVAALLAFLAKTGNAAKAIWVWAGGAAGVGLSVVVAVVVNLVFAQTGGTNREVVEGVVGLFAAVMLLYMSYWLHSKSSLGAWQRYIRDKSSSALARNSLVSLALISFLAVFREGAETVLFYLGIAPSISLGDLALGLALGAGGLTLIGVAMLVFGLRLPIRPFFLVAGTLVYYLAFKFIGTGIHALQVAGVVPVTPGPIPESTFFGVYPTWQTTAPQLALLLLAAAVMLGGRVSASSGPNGTGQAPA
ncbi:MAG TPA: FTR1 family protein [Candidatus Limnocylindria bacterium]|nr:FTR1 family protein [Candidatus Limnocylindria bacterium]